MFTHFFVKSIGLCQLLQLPCNWTEFDEIFRIIWTYIIYIYFLVLLFKICLYNYVNDETIWYNIYVLYLILKSHVKCHAAKNAIDENLLEQFVNVKYDCMVNCAACLFTIYMGWELHKLWINKAVGGPPYSYRSGWKRYYIMKYLQCLSFVG